MAQNITQIYRGATGMDLPKPMNEQDPEKVKKQEELQNQIKWANWRAEPITREFLDMLEAARNELLTGAIRGKEITIGFPDLILMRPDLPMEFLKVKMAEVGTLQKVLRATLTGKYNE